MMLTDIILYLYFLFWHLLIITAIVFFISGLDDLFYDIRYWSIYIVKFFKEKDDSKISYEQLNYFYEKHIAILVPCWQEAAVIEAMLRYNVYRLDYQKYDIFVGVYPNDHQTIKAVQSIAEIFSNIHCVIGPKNGPTNKADNLNSIYHYLSQYEKNKNINYEIIVFHDSEDIIHPLSLKLYNYLIPKYEMVQVPIYPLEVQLFNFTHWIYADEFSEYHTKELMIRELTSGFVPSAGVGTAFKKMNIELLKEKNNGQPFPSGTLTEDYSTSLRLHLDGFKQTFIVKTVFVSKWKKKWFLFGKYVEKKTKEYIATRALFPTEYIKSVRQKSRWILGISFQEWLGSGWPGNWMTRYILLHDRKNLITNIFNSCGYIIFLFWIVYSYLTFSNPTYPSLQEQFDFHPEIWYLVIFVTFVMIERLLQRMIAVYRIYGILPSLLSLPRAIYANILNIHATFRAYRIFLFSEKNKKKLKWDKTDHDFPIKEYLDFYKKKLGDYFLENNLITHRQLLYALNIQKQTGKKLGKILVEKKFITQQTLTYFLAKQYNMPLISKLDIPEQKIFLENDYLNQFMKINWLIKNDIFVYDYNENYKQLTLAIHDPTNEKLLKDIRKNYHELNIQWMLIRDF